MSDKLKAWLFSKGLANSRNTPCNPTGNSQVERYNGMVWKSILLALKSHNRPTTEWERLLPNALHSIRSLVYIATNFTSHEQMFNFHRCSATGQPMPSWFMHQGLHPQCTHVKLAEGREINVLIKQLALAGISSNKKKNIFNHIGNAQGVENIPQVTEDAVTTQNVKNCL